MLVLYNFSFGACLDVDLVHILLHLPAAKEGELVFFVAK
jgi:hypothetical protein